MSSRGSLHCPVVILLTIFTFIPIVLGGLPLFIRRDSNEEASPWLVDLANSKESENSETQPSYRDEVDEFAVPINTLGLTEASNTTNDEYKPSNSDVRSAAYRRNFFDNGFDSNLTVNELRALQGARMLEIMDLEADPCEDFYQYACGNWDSFNPLPADSIGIDTFEKLRDNVNLVLRSLLQDDTVVMGESSAMAKAKRLYKSCMNLDKIEERKEKPLLKSLEELGGWPLLRTNDSETIVPDWVEVMARLRLLNNDILVSMWIGPDGKNSEYNVIQLDQGDLALPSRSYYVENENLTSVFRAYANFVHSAALALGGTEAIVDKDVTDLLEFEIQLAMILIPAEDRRNFSAMYRKMTISDLDQLTKFIPWERYFKEVLRSEISLDEQVVVYAADYFSELGDLLNRTSDRTIVNYLMWRFVRHRLNNLDQRHQDLKQDLQAVLYGKRKQPERWKYCVSYVNGIMGMAVGSLFVRHFFQEDSKNDTTFLISEIQDVFTGMLNDSDWLDYDTKQNAVEKLREMSLKIGHPDYILNNTALDAEYEEVVIQEDKYFENVLGMLNYISTEEIKRLRQKVDREMWATSPAVVNAYYSRTRNQIMLPAGILQPPFYHTHFPKALNYGGIGVVIGHEITHGFDDQGRQYDWRGNLRSWWSIDTTEQFEEKSQCIIEQYNNYTSRIEGIEIPINGFNTQGENIADNGGVRQAFKAYEKWLDSAFGAIESEYLPGLNMTARQLFFLSFGQVWCGSMRPEAAFSKLKTAVHAPGRFRVIGSLSNFDEFTRAFDCPAGSKMNPDNRCVVW